jgi:hypothetical protein
MRSLILLSMGELWSLWGGLIDSCFGARSRSRQALDFVCVDLFSAEEIEIAFRRAATRSVPSESVTRIRGSCKLSEVLVVVLPA